MALDTKLCTFTGRMVIVGFGSIGQGVLPLLLRHIDGLTADRITIVTAEERGREEAELYGVAFHNNPLDNDNFFQVLKPLIDKGDFLVNLSVDVSSIALIEFCQRVGAFYTDTCTEPWAGGYTDSSLSPSLRSNYALRESALALRSRSKSWRPNWMVLSVEPVRGSVVRSDAYWSRHAVMAASTVRSESRAGSSGCT